MTIGLVSVYHQIIGMALMLWLVSVAVLILGLRTRIGRRAVACVTIAFVLAAGSRVVSQRVEQPQPPGSHAETTY